MLPFRFLIIFLLISAFAYAQHPTDTVLARQYYQTADSLAEHGQYGEANNLLRKAQHIYQSARSWKKYVACLNSIAYNLWPVANYDSAMAVAKRALLLSEEHLGFDHPEAARAHDVLGIVQLYAGQFKKALNHWKSSLQIREKHYQANHPKIADSYEFIGVAYHQMEKYDQALTYHQKSLAIRRKVYPANNTSLADNYDNIKDIHEIRGAYDLALNYLQQAHSIRKEVYEETHPLIATTYNELGMLYYRMGSYNQALVYFQRAIVIQKELFGERHPDVLTSYNNIGLAYDGQGSSDSALFYYQKSLSITETMFGRSHFSLAPTLNNIGIAYEKQGKYRRAVTYYQEASAILEKTFGKVHSFRAAIFRSIGYLYHKQQEYTTALTYYQRSFAANNAIVGEASLFTNPGIERYLDGKMLLYTLNSKAETLTALGLDSVTYSTYLLADSLINQLRYSYSSHGDKVSLSRIAKQIYEGGIQASLQRHQIAQDSQYLHTAFFLSEKSKAAVLADELSLREANRFGQIPDSLLALETSLKDQRALYQSQLGSSDSSTYKNKLFDTNQSYDSLIRTLEIQYPNYYRLKYATRTATIPDIQSQLASDEAVVSYFMGDSTYYAFAITADQFRVVPLLVDTVLSKQIVSLRQVPQQDSVFTTYHHIAYDLYRQLVAPVVVDTSFATIKKLTIVPDGELGYLPFDLLLTKSFSSKSNYASLPYLLKDYTIRYGYSATWLFHPFSRPKSPATNQYIAFAPHYPATTSDTMQQLAFGRFRDQVAPLRWNLQEVESIGQHLSGVGYSHQAAVERRFKEEAKQYRIVHLAMHALVDDQNPMDSRLVFSQDTADTTEDGYLNAYELYDMEIPADLVVLSACETGYGKLERGEGIMSLARAFAYAGCPSIVMSHWLVDDKSSAQLMDYLYRYLSEGLPKDEALRQAKLAYLETASVQKAHPFFWANFVLIGDAEPIVESPISRKGWLFTIAIGLLLLSAIYLYLRRRQLTSSFV